MIREKLLNHGVGDNRKLVKRFIGYNEERRQELERVVQAALAQEAIARTIASDP